MSAHGYFSIDKDKIKHMSFFKNGSHHRMRNGWVYKNGVYIHVWSGASVVHYYDNTTLLGTEEVDEGEDVLHPSITTTKSNYTLIGWSTEPNNLNKQVTSLVATGEEMNLYALYLPNSLNVVSNSRYISGSTYTSHAETPYYVGGQSLDSSTSFTLNMREYQNNVVTVHQSNIYSGQEDNDQPYGYGQFDGNDVAKNSSRTFTNIANGTHTLRTIGHTANEGSARNTQELRCYVASLVLSNPIAWE